VVLEDLVGDAGHRPADRLGVQHLRLLAHQKIKNPRPTAGVFLSKG
jgi:hypothetical protein